MASDDLYRVKESFAYDDHGVPVVVSEGELVRAGHPLMKGREQLLDPIHIHWDVPKAAESPRTTGAKAGGRA